MDGVVINRITPVNPGDPKGPTYEWCRDLPGRQVSVYVRPAGTQFGSHYHTGSDPSKNPERFFLAKGTLRMRAENPAGERLEELVGEGTEILISPYVKHAMVALTDVVFVEYRATPFDGGAPDTFPASI